MSRCRQGVQIILKSMLQSLSKWHLWARCCQQFELTHFVHQTKKFLSTRSIVELKKNVFLHLLREDDFLQFFVVVTRIPYSLSQPWPSNGKLSFSGLQSLTSMAHIVYKCINHFSGCGALNKITVTFDFVCTDKEQILHRAKNLCTSVE